MKKRKTLRIRQNRSYKAQGEYVEAMFVARSMREGFRVLRLWGDSGPYDYVLAHGRRFSRVQVKGTTHRKSGGYVCNVTSGRGGGRTAYTHDDIDFLVAYIIPDDIWYVFPVDVVSKLSSIIFLNPRRFNAKYNGYLGAWNQMYDDSCVVEKIMACVDPSWVEVEPPAPEHLAAD